MEEGAFFVKGIKKKKSCDRALRPRPLSGPYSAFSVDDFYGHLLARENR